MKARPTTYKGIEMRSRLEAGYAAWLDTMGWEWAYEPRAFASEDGQYLPDFRIEDVYNRVAGECSHAYVEIKPHSRGLDIVFQRMEVIWDSEPKAQLLIQVPPPEVTMVHDLIISPAVYWWLPSGNFVVLAWEFQRKPHLTTPRPVSHSAWAGEYWNVNHGLAPATRSGNKRTLGEVVRQTASDQQD